MTAVKFETNLSDSYVSYFRHKGLKVQFKDIEDVLVEYPYINKVAILFSEDKEGNRRLIAYIIPYGTFSQSDAIKFLKDKLESYMIPAVWICMDQFPLTPSGNIDKHALHEPQEYELPSTAFIAPRTDKELKLAIIIKKILQLESIGVTDNFLRLGGNSLQALKIVAAIRKELNLQIDIKYFFIYPTIAGLAAYLDSIDGSADSQYYVRARQALNQGSIFHRTSIVPIKTGGKKIPLYIICGGGGSVFTFKKFAYLLDDDQPVYGFQQPSDINELEQFPDTIETIAAKYVDEMLMIDPNGPYALSGHCIGGAIALEMARQLQALGKKIHLLAMFDVVLTKNEQQPVPSTNNFLNLKAKIKQAGKKLWNKVAFETFLITRYPLGVLDYRQEKLLNALNKVLHFKKENPDLIVFNKFEQKFIDAYAKYKVQHFSGNMIVFYAKNHYRFLDKDKGIFYKKYSLSEEVKNLWKKYANDIKIYEIDGEHSSMFQGDGSNNFAGLLQHHLKSEAY